MTTLICSPAAAALAAEIAPARTHFLAAAGGPRPDRAAAALADLCEWAQEYEIDEAVWSEAVVRLLEDARARVAAALFAPGAAPCLA